jgi:hypothetical protein
MNARTGVLLGVWVLASAGAASAEGARALTCDPDRIDPRSYRLTTLGLAAAVTEDRSSWWERADFRGARQDLEDLNFDVARIAERALRIDPGNRMAHAVLARQFLIDGDADRAQSAWRNVLESGGAVGWTGTLYDVDPERRISLPPVKPGVGW